MKDTLNPYLTPTFNVNVVVKEFNKNVLPAQVKVQALNFKWGLPMNLSWRLKIVDD